MRGNTPQTNEDRVCHQSSIRQFKIKTRTLFIDKGARSPPHPSGCAAHLPPEARTASGGRQEKETPLPEVLICGSCTNIAAKRQYLRNPLPGVLICGFCTNIAAKRQYLRNSLPGVLICSFCTNIAAKRQYLRNPLPGVPTES